MYVTLKCRNWRVFKPRPFVASLLPAGRKFCKITKPAPEKIVGREKLAAVWPPFLARSGLKQAEKNI
jgi:hypothetical protein